jgi:hypothetical protein
MLMATQTMIRNVEQIIRDHQTHPAVVALGRLQFWATTVYTWIPKGRRQLGRFDHVPGFPWPVPDTEVHKVVGGPQPVMAEIAFWVKQRRVVGPGERHHIALVVGAGAIDH